MAIADMIPTMDDEALVSLRANAQRLSLGEPGPKTAEAGALLPLLDTELAAREALKPPKVTKARSTKASRAAAAAEAAQAEEDAEEADEAEVAEIA